MQRNAPRCGPLIVWVFAVTFFLFLLEVKSQPNDARHTEERNPSEHASISLSETKAALRHSRLDWVHIPKTGTSFGSLLVEAMCPRLFHSVALDFLPLGFDDHVFPRTDFHSNELQSSAEQCLSNFRRWGSHRPVPVRKVLEERTILSIVREPLSRIVSGYFHRMMSCETIDQQYGIRKRKEGASNVPDKPQSLNWDNEMEMSNEDYLKFVRENYAQGNASILAYAKCVEGCQANLLSGFGRCGDRKNEALEPEQQKLRDIRRVRAALRTLNNRVLFVGLTDRWHETSSLFLSLFDIQPHNVPSSNVRPSIINSSSLQDEVLETLKQSGFRDFADEVVYSRATQMFETLLQAVTMDKLSGTQRRGKEKAGKKARERGRVDGYRSWRGGLAQGAETGEVQPWEARPGPG
eukprot:CAMPEP_0181298378 /NCGR_PEP_ID=MMETSP1101-20121128/5748_1 /TAXON_ID=46948 /ORGANISM="Rhodomonas abbreviata, Strain Caron Lab Isolate" /LENGTH=407 /DNA_ID=CAMNT_0023403391 /DNA_START=354 /DNA_END=1573 /DNA_ORIENTATION=-